MTLGAGRPILQDLPRINQAIQDGTFLKHPLFQNTWHHLKETGGAFHVLALLSDGGVHAHIDHVITLLEALGNVGIPAWIHGFLDGRDVAPQSAWHYLQQLAPLLNRHPTLRWATLGGRAFGMDRNQNWQRTKAAYDVIAKPVDVLAPEQIHTWIEDAYQQGILRDEDIPPVAIAPYSGIDPRDAMCFMNFRVDRIRQLASALMDPAFDGFERAFVSTARGLTLCEISTHHNQWITPLFPQEIPKGTLGEVMAANGLTQLRLAETEKYAHVTFFFNGGKEDPFKGETRVLIPSPEVKSYDQRPQMSAQTVTDTLTQAIRSKAYDFILVNYANADMVGHTAQQAPILKAIETLDGCLGNVLKAVQEMGATLLITADHGNAEQLQDLETGAPHTAHTCNEVPCIWVGSQVQAIRLSKGTLADVAPTILKAMGLEINPLMQGHPLF